MNRLSFKSPYVLTAGAILVLAAILRLYNLGGPSLWLDEAVYANNSYCSFADFLANTRTNNSSPIILPFLYWVLGASVRSTFTARLLPMLFGFLSVFIILLMPRAGIQKKAALISGLWLAILPVQINYSQEVREYSLSVLISSLIIYALFRNTSKDRSLFDRILFLFCIAIAPFSSYGNIFIAGIAIAFLFAHDIKNKQILIHQHAANAIIYLTAIVFSYLLTAKFQMGIGKAQYLLDYYPPSGLAAKIAWLAKSAISYFGFMIGGRIPMIGSVVTLCAFGLNFLKDRNFWKSESILFFFWLTIFAAAITLAAIGLYPFGGIRQVIYTSPALILAIVVTYVFLVEKTKFSTALRIAFVSIIAIPSCLSNIRSVYGEIEDVKTTVSIAAKSTQDANIFIYHGAIPAVKFHFPKRGFAYSSSSKNQQSMMLNEVKSIKGSTAALVFSHIIPGEDDSLINALHRAGYTILRDTATTGSRLTLVQRPSESIADKHAAITKSL